MADQPGWYPSGQVLYPPVLPAYLKNVYDLKPIVGVPSDTEVIGIHAVIHAGNRVSGVPGMHDPGLVMKLADHLFGAQMARYRSRYSLVTFPSDATYTPPTLPTHLNVSLEPVVGAPSDDEIVKVQDALQIYQELRRIPSMFDSHISMELSQHLFDLQMARYMRIAGETPPSSLPEVTTNLDIPTQTLEHSEHAATESTPTTNNVGTGASVLDGQQEPRPVPGVNVHDLLERSNQLAERFNQLLERSNELVERNNQPANEPSPPTLSERFNQVLERLTQLVERPHVPTERSDRLTERFNQLFERFNQLVEQSNQSAQRDSQFANEAIKRVEGFGETFKTINRVLVGIQHAIVRVGTPRTSRDQLIDTSWQSRKGNTQSALDCLVNENGQTPGQVYLNYHVPFADGMHFGLQGRESFSAEIGGGRSACYVPRGDLGRLVQFYGIGDGLFEDSTNETLIRGKVGEALERLEAYFSSCLG